MSDTQKPIPSWIQAFDLKFHVTEQGNFPLDEENRTYSPDPYDIKEFISRLLTAQTSQLQKEVELFIVDQRNHEVSPEHIVDSIVPLIEHIRRSL